MSMQPAQAEPSASAMGPTTAPNVPKIPIRLRPVGQAPPLTNAKFQLSGSRSIFDVEIFLRGKIESDKSKPVGLFLYCGTGFSPTPDQLLQDLYDCFQIGGELVIMYGLQENWG
jgi:ubiquitin-like protein ATG12